MTSPERTLTLALCLLAALVSPLVGYGLGGLIL